MRFLLTLCSLFLASTANAGKVLMEGIPSTDYVIHVDTNNHVVRVEGSTLAVVGPIYSTGTAGHNLIEGAGTRFVWDPSSAAIRAGKVNGTQWDSANIGPRTAVFGENNKSTATNSGILAGINNVISDEGYSAITCGKNNRIDGTDDSNIISCGENNIIYDGTSVNISGGEYNEILSNWTGVIGGGHHNKVYDQQGTIGGGAYNQISTGAAGGTVAGGEFGYIHRDGTSGTISGGFHNYLNGYAGVICGGEDNFNYGALAVTCGGEDNRTYGDWSGTLAGKDLVASGTGSIALGRRAKSTAEGSFTFADWQDADFINNSTNTFKTRFAGGYYFTGGTSTMTALIVEGNASFGSASFPASSVDLSTVTAALALKADKGNTSHIDLSTVTVQFNYVAVATTTLDADLTQEVSDRQTADLNKVDKNTPEQVNLSTVTIALALKADKGNTSHIDLSTVTAAIALKLDDAAIPSGYVDFSTITVALLTKSNIGEPTHVDLSTVTVALLTKVDKNTPEQVNLSTVTTALATKADKGNTSHLDLSTVTAAISLKLDNAAIPAGYVDFSTITSALAGKVDKNAPEQINLSTVTAALALKLNNAAIPAGYVDFSTITTALATKSTIGEPTHVDLSTITAALAGKQPVGSYLVAADIAGKADIGEPTHINLSTVTVALALKVDKNTPEQINLSTVTVALGLKADKGNTSHIDLSTVTAALALKLDNAAIPSGYVDFSTITTALAGKAPLTGAGTSGTWGISVTGNAATVTTNANLTGPVTSVGNATTIVGPVYGTMVDLSTVTTALASKQAADADLDDLADGSLTGSKVGDGVPAANIAAGNLPNDVIVSSVAAQIAAGTCGSATISCRLSYAADGRITSVSSETISGGSGASLSGDNTFTGTNVFQDTTTVGYSSLVLTSTANMSAVLTNGESLVAFSSVTAASKAWFYGLSSTTTWRVEYCFKQNTSVSNWSIQFNGDSSGVYQAAGRCENTGSALAINRSNDTQGYIKDVSNGLAANGQVCGEVTIRTLNGLPKSIIARSELTTNTNNVTWCSSSVGYYQSANLSSFNFYTTGGSITGWMKLYASTISQSLD